MKFQNLLHTQVCRTFYKSTSVVIVGTFTLLFTACTTSNVESVCAAVNLNSIAVDTEESLIRVVAGTCAMNPVSISAFYE